MLIPGRAAVLMIVTLALGPGILTNVLLKDAVGPPASDRCHRIRRRRAFRAVVEPARRLPEELLLRRRRAVGRVLDAGAGGAGAAAWRALAYAGALTFGAAVGLMRIAGGGHFFTDVVFAGVFTFLLIWLVHGLLYRWRATRTTDEAVERKIARLRGVDDDKGVG